jgi:hypothetical protein
MGLFLSGGALKFAPLIVGGIFCWICGAAAFCIEKFCGQNIYLLLILAAAVLGGYIIPGYMLKLNNKK